MEQSSAAYSLFNEVISKAQGHVGDLHLGFEHSAHQVLIHRGMRDDDIALLNAAVVGLLGHFTGDDGARLHIEVQAHATAVERLGRIVAQAASNVVEVPGRLDMGLEMGLHFDDLIDRIVDIGAVLLDRPNNAFHANALGDLVAAHRASHGDDLVREVDRTDLARIEYHVFSLAFCRFASAFCEKPVSHIGRINNSICRFECQRFFLNL